MLLEPKTSLLLQPLPFATAAPKGVPSPLLIGGEKNAARTASPELRRRRSSSVEARPSVLLGSVAAAISGHFGDEHSRLV
nr:hypothetical protein Iba_chr02eCG6810 [Ipomoea batatas]